MGKLQKKANIKILKAMLKALKKGLIISILLGGLFGCSLVVEEPVKEVNLDDYEIPEYNFEMPLGIQRIVNKERFSLSEKRICIASWVKDYIEYKLDIDVWGVEDYWQSPKQTLTMLSGDCEDRALLFSYILEYYNLYTKDEIIFYSLKYIKETKDSPKHMIIYIQDNDNYYDYYYNLSENYYIMKTNENKKIEYTLNINKKFSYIDALKISHYFHKDFNYLNY